MTFDQSTRNSLQRFVNEMRRTLEEGVHLPVIKRLWVRSGARRHHAGRTLLLKWPEGYDWQAWLGRRQDST